MVGSVQAVGRGVGGIGGDERNKRLFGNTSGWRRTRANLQVRLGGNEGRRDRDSPWKPVALEGGARQNCSVGLEMAGTRWVIGDFGEKYRDRKRMTRLQRGG